MNILKWIPIFSTLALCAQEVQPEDLLTDTLSLDSISVYDPSLFQKAQNSFLEEDDLLLLGHHPFEETTLSNLGSPRVPLWWKPNNHLNMTIGDRRLDHLSKKAIYTSVFKESFPHTKIIYAPTLVEGQKMNVIHQRPYKYGSVLIDYDRIVSEGNLVHEKLKTTRFAFHGNFSHPNIPYSSEWRFHTFKNESNWNGGITDDELFLSNSESNWELLPTQWTSLNTETKQKGLDWKHTYRYSNSAEIDYELKVSRDSLFYKDLQEDGLFYPTRTDSANSIIRVFTSTNHALRWNKKIDTDKDGMLGLSYHNFDFETSNIKQYNIHSSLSSVSLKNRISLAAGTDAHRRFNLLANYQQKIFFLGLNHQFELGFEKTHPSWRVQNDIIFYDPIEITDVNKPSTHRYLEWNMNLNEAISLYSSYHKIDDHHYYNASAMATQSEETIQIFQSRLKYKIHYKKWNWKGQVGYQNCSNTEIPMVEFLTHQKIYWQGSILKKATWAQLGTRIRYKSSHPGMRYSPMIGDFYVSPLDETEASLRCDLFANFQIKTLKIHLTYEHINGLGQGNQYVLKPYPMTKPFFRMSLIWNFYD